jgi:hypothetical protein
MRSMVEGAPGRAGAGMNLMGLHGRTSAPAAPSTTPSARPPSPEGEELAA